MGNVLKKLFGNKEMRILMLGLDAAGKTSELLGHLSVPFFLFRNRCMCHRVCVFRRLCLFLASRPHNVSFVLFGSLQLYIIVELSLLPPPASF